MDWARIRQLLWFSSLEPLKETSVLCRSWVGGRVGSLAWFEAGVALLSELLVNASVDLQSLQPMVLCCVEIDFNSLLWYKFEASKQLYRYILGGDNYQVSL